MRKCIRCDSNMIYLLYVLILIFVILVTVLFASIWKHKQEIEVFDTIIYAMKVKIYSFEEQKEYDASYMPMTFGIFEKEFLYSSTKEEGIEWKYQITYKRGRTVIVKFDDKGNVMINDKYYKIKDNYDLYGSFQNRLRLLKKNYYSE